jgi:multisubunit Na+/H+ antiporter MnhB subunit
MSTIALQLFDGLLVITLIALAWAALSGDDERRSVILFMGFGLVLALAWGRLLAPDVALAEAAIGSGLSGALLLAAVRDSRRRATVADASNKAGVDRSLPLRLVKWTVTSLCAALAGIFGWALFTAFTNPATDTLARSVAENLTSSGVSNPVTAVLLNFRAYDTLLELAVLLTAMLGILALGRGHLQYRPPGTVFESLARWLVPVLVVTAGYLLWVGGHAPGGAFQAGATLAAAGVVMQLAGRSRNRLPGIFILRLLITAGVGIFLLVGLALMLAGRPFLDYPEALAGSMILIIEGAATLAIATTLVLAFAGGAPHPESRRGSGCGMSQGQSQREKESC